MALERDSSADLDSSSSYSDARNSLSPPPPNHSTASTPSPVPLASPSSSPAVASKRTAVIFQEACVKHKYIRTADSTSLLSIVERPERIRAVKTGVASAWARLENRALRTVGGSKWTDASESNQGADGGLEALMEGLRLDKGKGREVVGGPFDILLSTAVLPVDDPALLFVHPLPNEGSSSSVPPPPPSPSSLPRDPFLSATPSTSAPQDFSLFSSTASKLPQPPPRDLPEPWPSQLQALCRDSKSAIQTPPHSEIPQHLPQGDLYLSPGSEEAIFGALGAVCEGVDRIVAGASSVGGYDRAFVAVRPPGHHCCENQPMGFCFVNNVAVAAAHAHQQHGIDRVVIIDIDLHHGNGTQDIAWRINAAANAAATSQRPVSPRKGSPSKPQKVDRQLSVMYASLHDVFSYPCEDGDPALVQAASINLSGGHSQYIANVHLDSWTHEAEFHEKLYHRYRDGLLGAAGDFCAKTAIEDDESDRTIIFLSAGFDASEHESAGMSRHRRNVPTSFYHRIARDICKFANTHARGKVLAVLEGGYSDRALTSGVLATLVGLAESPRFHERTFVIEDGDERKWWDPTTLVKIERACKLGRGGKLGGAGAGEGEEWLARTVEIFARIEGSEGGGKELKDGGQKEVPRTMQLRERRPRGTAVEDAMPQGSPTRPKGGQVSRGKGPLVALPTTTLPSTAAAFAPPPPPPPALPTALPPTSTPFPTKVEPHDEDAGVPGTLPALVVPIPKIKFTWKEGGIGGDARG